MKRAVWACSILLFLLNGIRGDAQIVINEYVAANVNGILNGVSNDDWIEIYNSGSSTVNLQGYGLSNDNTKPYLFRFPSYSLPSHGYVLVFASDTNNDLPVNHWETAVNANTSWKYFAGVIQPDTNWRNLTFNDAGWSSGNGGIGFGDGDDATVISMSAKSVMMRKTFNITDTSAILKAIFNMDYDDGFVAYLNGSEIARANLGVQGDRPAYNVLASLSHEAQMYQGLNPDSFFIDPTYLKSILRTGMNVLAVETHNQTATSNDLTSKPYLSFGMRNSGSTFSNPPSWFRQSGIEYFNAKFKLSRNGATIYLTDPSGTLADQQTYSAMQPDNSMGRKPDGGSNWCLIKTPTPLATNNSSTCYTGYAIQPGFSIGPGFYPSSQYVALTNTTPGGSIRYTTNGDVPTTSSHLYSSPIHLTTSKVIRARVFANGYLPSPVITNTYVINDVIHLPVFSITTDSLNLWDYNTGIYVMGPNASQSSPYFGANFWQDWRVPATIEYFDKTKTRLLNFDADICVFGNYSRAKPQKSMEIILEGKYGTSSIDFTLIPDKPNITSYDDFILRNSGTDWNVVHFRDAFMERVLKSTHTGYLAAEPAVMYLNGSYWGVFTIDENHDQHWMKNNFGYDDNQIDYMKEAGSTVTVKRGSDNFFWDAYNYGTTTSASAPQYYNTMGTYWDLDNYKDYFISETFYDNGDWIGAWTNNIKYWRPLDQGGKLRFLVYDLDFGCGYGGNYKDSTLSHAINPSAHCYTSDLFRSMLNNAQFKKEFINRYADLLNTAFLPSQMLPIMHQFEDSMSFDMTKHFAKWGSTVSNWHSNINDMVSFINQRPAEQRNQIQHQFNLHSQVTLTFNVSPAGAGKIQVSTITPGPLPWTGIYFNGNPVTITAIPNPGYTFNHWNSPHTISNDHNQTTTYNFSHNNETITAYFTGSPQPALLTVSEFNYNSSPSFDAKDWIELHNYGSFDLDISGWKIKNQNDYDSYTIPVGTVLAPNGYLVVSTNLYTFSAIYPTVTNVIGPLGFTLSNAGDQIRIYNSSDQLYLSLFYQDSSPWPVLSDGQGYTNELSSSTANLNDGASWFVGCIGGSPGRAFTSVLSSATHVSGNSTFCVGGNTMLSVNYTPGYTYQWQRNHIDIPSATDTVFLATLNGAYTVNVTFQGCASTSDTLNVSIVTTGQVPPVVTSASRCGDGTVTLSATATDSIYWFDAPGGNILGTGPVFTTPTITSTTTFYAQTSLACPSTPVAVDAVVIPVTQDPVVSDTSLCGPGSLVLNAVDTATAYWYNDATGGALIYTGNVFQTGYIPYDTTFYVEAGTGCVSDRIAVNVTINSPIPPAVNTSSRCGGGSLILTANSLSPVLWYDSLVAGNLVATGNSFHTPILSATKIYYAESNNGCASARTQAIAMVNPIPSPPIADDSSICGSGSVALYATANFQIFWYDTPTGGTALASGSLFNTPPITSTTTFYAEADDICAGNRTPVQAVINPLPASPVAGDANICGSGSALLSATSSNTVYWFDQVPGGTVLATGNSYVTPVLNATTVYYAVAISNCTSIPTAVTALITPVPSTWLGNDTTIQSGSSLTLDAGAGFDSYFWSTGETTQTISVNSTGNYSVYVLLNGCAGADTITVTVILGIQEASSLTGSINVFPNPVKDRLTIQFESKKSYNASVLVSDIAGQILKSEDLKLMPGPNTKIFDMSGYAKGVYFITFRSEDYSKTMSISVE